RAEVRELVGRVVSFSPGRRLANTVTSARREADDLVVTLRDDVAIGLGRVAKVSGARIETRTNFIRGGVYVGATLYAANGVKLGRIQAEEETAFELEAPPPDGAVKEGDDVWIVAMGPGDAFEAPAL